MLKIDVHGLLNPNQEQQLLQVNAIPIHVLLINKVIMEFVLTSIVGIKRHNKFVLLRVQNVKKRIQLLSHQNNAI